MHCRAYSRSCDELASLPEPSDWCFATTQLNVRRRIGLDISFLGNQQAPRSECMGRFSCREVNRHSTIRQDRATLTIELWRNDPSRTCTVFPWLRTKRTTSYPNGPRFHVACILLTDKELKIAAMIYELPHHRLISCVVCGRKLYDSPICGACGTTTLVPEPQSLGQFLLTTVIIFAVVGFVLYCFS